MNTQVISKIITAIVISVIVSSGSLPTQHQLQALHQGGYWDGTLITAGSNTAEVKSDKLIINGKTATEFSVYNTKAEVVKSINLSEDSQLT